MGCTAKRGRERKGRGIGAEGRMKAMGEERRGGYGCM